MKMSTDYWQRFSFMYVRTYVQYVQHVQYVQYVQYVPSTKYGKYNQYEEFVCLFPSKEKYQKRGVVLNTPETPAALDD